MIRLFKLYFKYTCTVHNHIFLKHTCILKTYHSCYEIDLLTLALTTCCVAAIAWDAAAAIAALLPAPM